MTYIWYLIALALVCIPFAAMVFLPLEKSKPILLIFFLIFVVFMYGPMLTMAVLSLQGTHGSMTLPAKELLSLHWYSELNASSSVMIAVRDGIGKSLWLSAIVAVITDRRALLVSALTYLGIVIGYAITNTIGQQGADKSMVFFATLVVLGAEDRMGSPTVSSERWKAGLARAGNTRATVTTIAGMGHAATMGSMHAQGGAVMPEYTKVLSTFLATVR